MGVTFSARKPQKSQRKKRRRIKKNLYYDGTNEEVSTESIDSQTFPKVTDEDWNKQLERKDQELARKNESLEEFQLRIREYQNKVEVDKAKREKLEEENLALQDRIRAMTVSSAQEAKPSVKVSHASTSTDQQGAEEKRGRTKEAATNTDTEASPDTSDRNNTNTSCKAKNAQVGNNNVMNVVKFYTSGNDQNTDQKSKKDDHLRIRELEKSKRELQRELQIEKDKVEILRRQNEVLEGKETKLLENSLPFRTADFSFIRNLRYL